MSEIAWMTPQPLVAPKKQRDAHRFAHNEAGVSPGKLAKDDKPTKVKAVPRPGLPVLLAMLLALAASMLSACDGGCEPQDGRSFGEHAVACRNMCLPALVTSYKNGVCECSKIPAATDGGVR